MKTRPDLCLEWSASPTKLPSRMSFNPRICISFGGDMKRKSSNTLAVTLSAVMLIVMSAPVFAQTSRGTVTGTVTDPQGAVIQGATAELKNTLTNQTRTAPTNDAGLYRCDAVDLGIYDLKISAQGFKTHTSRGIEIQANRVATFDA